MVAFEDLASEPVPINFISGRALVDAARAADLGSDVAATLASVRRYPSLNTHVRLMRLLRELGYTHWHPLRGLCSPNTDDARRTTR